MVKSSNLRRVVSHPSSVSQKQNVVSQKQKSNNTGTLIVLVLMLIFIVMHSYPLIFLMKSGYSPKCFDLYEPYIKSQFNGKVDDLIDPFQIYTIISSALAGVGLIFFTKNKKNNKINIILAGSILSLLIFLIVSSCILFNNIKISSDSIGQAYGKNVYENLLKFTSVKFKEYLSLLFVMIGYKVGTRLS